MKTKPLIAAGIIFSVFALIHILRATLDWQIVIAGYAVPMYVSVIAAVVAIGLAIWMFAAAEKE